MYRCCVYCIRRGNKNNKVESVRRYNNKNNTQNNSNVESENQIEPGSSCREPKLEEEVASGKKIENSPSESERQQPEQPTPGKQLHAKF